MTGIATALLLVLALLPLGSGDVAASAVIEVSTVEDEIALNGNCSLREAIIAANTDALMDACPSGAGADTVLVPAGAYRLAIPGRGEQGSAAGDLDIAGDLTLLGAGAQQTVVDANHLDRVFEILPGASVSISRLSIVSGDPGAAQDGGGILVSTGARLALSDTEVRGNRVASDRWGGGIRNRGAAILDLTRVLSNTAGYAGGIDNSGVLTATRATVGNNVTTYFAGGVYSATQLRIGESTISGNVSGTNGAGLYLPSGISDLNNVTISGNKAKLAYGGGIWVYYGAGLVLTNTTISNNSALAGAGISYMEPPGLVGSALSVPSANDEVKVQNSLLADNLGKNCTRNLLVPPMISLGHNLDSDGSCEFHQPGDLNVTDARLAALQDNGGPTWTHALGTGSPAIDAGDDAACPQTDQRGIRRSLDGDGDGVATCDIGAFESGGGRIIRLFLPMVHRL